MEVAILLAAYQGEKYIKEQLDSLENQTYSDFKCYIHDDNSTDNTKAIIDEWVSTHDRFYALEGEALHSAKKNFLWMLKEVEADTYLFCDQDDVWDVTKVEKEVFALSKLDDTKPACAFCDMAVTDESMNVTAESFIALLQRDPNVLRYQRIMIDNPAAGCTMCFNRALRDLAICVPKEKFDDVLMHDHFIMSLCAVVGNITYVDEALVKYRQHSGNTMGAEVPSTAKKVAMAIKDVATGNFIRKKQAFHKNERRLAEAMLMTFANQFECHLSEGDEVVLETLCGIDKERWAKRHRFYRKNHFDRMRHSIWMRMWV